MRIAERTAHPVVGLHNDEALAHKLLSITRGSSSQSQSQASRAGIQPPIVPAMEIA